MVVDVPVTAPAGLKVLGYDVKVRTYVCTYVGGRIEECPHRHSVGCTGFCQEILSGGHFSIRGACI